MKELRYVLEAIEQSFRRPRLKLRTGSERHRNARVIAALNAPERATEPAQVGRVLASEGHRVIPLECDSIAVSGRGLRSSRA